MEIYVNRLLRERGTIMGTLKVVKEVAGEGIELVKVCGTVEREADCLPAGKYRVRIGKCKRLNRKMPLVPVICMTVFPQRRRCMAASCCRVSSTSLTSTKRSSTATSGLSTTAAAHPCSSARAAKRFPSNDSPLRAKKIEPLGQSRLSVVTCGCCR